MNTQEEIVSFLKETYHPLAIVLHGSRVSDKVTEGSDWDLVVIVEENIFKNGPVSYKDEQLDIMFHVPSEMGTVLKNSHGYPLAQACVLSDTNDVGKNTLESTKRARLGGMKLSSREKENREQRMKRTLHRIKRWEENRPVSFAYEALFYQLALRYWFELRNLFPENVRESIEIFERNDKDFLSLLKKFLEGKEKAVVAEEIYRKLF